MACLYFLNCPNQKKCQYYGNMTDNMTQRSPNMFAIFPMKYFSVPNGHIVYAHEVQGPKMTSSHIL